MTVWAWFKGKAKLQNDPKVREIYEVLDQKIPGQPTISLDKWDDYLELYIEGGDYFSSGYADDVITLLKSFDPYVLKPSRIIYKIDDERCHFWLGDPQAAEEAMAQLTISRIRKKLSKLTPEQQGKLIPPGILKALAQCGFLLNKVATECPVDTDAAYNAAGEAAQQLKLYNADDEWCEEYL